jgi:phage baseplate assembly protein W
VSQGIRNNFNNITTTKQYQPEFPLEYNTLYGPYSAITEKDDSLSRNFINLLLTCPGEWPMNPDLGIGLRRYLFEQSGSSALQNLKPIITKQLNKYLPHIKLHSLEMSNTPEDIDNNTIKIKINYVIRNNTYASLLAYMDKLASIKIEYKKIKQFLETKNKLVPTLDTDLISRQVIF